MQKDELLKTIHEVYPDDDGKKTLLVDLVKYKNKVNLDSMVKACELFNWDSNSLD